MINARVNTEESRDVMCAIRLTGYHCDVMLEFRALIEGAVQCIQQDTPEHLKDRVNDEIRVIIEDVYENL